MNARKAYKIWLFFQVTFVVDKTDSSSNDMSEIIEVELVKKTGKGLGLSVVGRRDGTGVFVSDMVGFRSSYL